MSEPYQLPQILVSSDDVFDSITNDRDEAYTHVSLRTGT